MSAELLTPTELSQALKVSIQTIYYWVHRQEIPYLKLGKHLRFRLDDVLSAASWRSPAVAVQANSLRSLKIRDAGPAVLPVR